MSDLTAEAEGLLHGGREDMTLRRVMDLLQRKRIIRKGQAERDVGALATLLGYTVTHIPGGEYLIWPLGEAGDVPPYIGGLSLRGAAAWLVYRDARETLQADWDNKLGLVSSRGSDTRQWRVQDEGSEADGFYVVGYNPYQTDAILRKMSSLFGPYATLEDAEAVVAAKDSSARPLSERLLEREREETEEWLRSKKESEEE